MRRTLILLALALVGIVSAGTAGGAEPAGAPMENRVALEEYALAKPGLLFHDGSPGEDD